MTLAVDPRAVELLRDAARWRLVALLLERPRRGWLDELAALARDAADPALTRAVESAADATEGFHLAYLGPGGPVSPREAGHRRCADPGRTLSELEAYYREFAFRPLREDPLDHVAVETAFVAYLRLKQAYAAARGRDDEAELCARAAEAFVAEHLALIAEPLAHALMARDAGYLALAGEALLALTGPRPPGFEGDWVPKGLAEGGSELTCGMDAEG